MTDEKPHARKGGGSKLNRSEQVSIRLDARLRMAAEMAAAKERRTLSSYIEWAVEQATRQTIVAWDADREPLTAMEVAFRAWDVDEADRFVNLAQLFPQLLTHEEQRKWKFICETPEFWRPLEKGETTMGQLLGVSKAAAPNLPAIRMAWDLIDEAMAGRGFDWNSFVNSAERYDVRVHWREGWAR